MVDRGDPDECRKCDRPVDATVDVGAVGTGGPVARGTDVCAHPIRGAGDVRWRLFIHMGGADSE